MPQPGVIEPSDTCARCGLQRATHALEEQGITVTLRLCDDCYWGSGDLRPAPEEPATPGR
jgi:hypothetical protein